MIKRFAVICAIAFVFGYFWLGRDSGEPGELNDRKPYRERAIEEEPEPPPAKSAPLVKPAPAPAPKPAAPAVNTILPMKEAERPGNPPKGTASFVLKKDLVIVYGDVLIGKPTKPDFPERGFIKIPKKQEWGKHEIAFSLHQDLPNPERVLRVIEYFNTNTPVRFVPLTDQKDSIVFAPTDIPLCLSYVGRIGGHQPIFLHDRCLDGEIVHEVMHSLGFIHEHSRPDRDQYVNVRWGAIDPEAYSQYEIVPDILAETVKGRPFDYNSVMLYNETAFGRVRGDITMDSRYRDNPVAPVSEGLSAEDLQRLIIKYGGAANGSRKPNDESGGGFAE